MELDHTCRGHRWGIATESCQSWMRGELERIGQFVARFFAARDRGESFGTIAPEQRGSTVAAQRFGNLKIRRLRPALSIEKATAWQHASLVVGCEAAAALEQQRVLPGCVGCGGLGRSNARERGSTARCSRQMTAKTSPQETDAHVSAIQDLEEAALARQAGLQRSQSCR